MAEAMANMDATRAVAVVDHYQKTAELIAQHWERRGTQFVTLILVLAGAVLVAFSRPLIAPALEAFVQAYVMLEGDSLARLKGLTPVAGDLLLAFLVVTVFYLTASLVNRTSIIMNYYLYMSLLEEEIRAAFQIPRGQFAFTREGAFYELASSSVSRLIGRCYKAVLGSLLILFFAARLFFDFPRDLPALGLGSDILLQWASKSFLFLVDVLIVVPTLWLFFRFAWLGPMQEADARRKMTRIEA
jgi:hypothetical protein